MPYLRDLHLYCLAAAFLLLISSCGPSHRENHKEHTGEKKIGILLLNHGSRSERWKEPLLELEERVSEKILEIEGVGGIETAFMEHARPSIADGLKAFDSAGCSDIVVIPIFLTVGTHMFDDIPTIIGLKANPASLEKLKLENIERYTPEARVHLAPPLDFSDILKKNALRRAGGLSVEPQHEGLVLVGYGSTEFDRQWTELFDEVGDHISRETGITEHATAWCGHVAHYSPDSTTAVVRRMLSKKQRAIVIPLLVSTSEAFQIDIIGNAIAALKDHGKRVSYKPDAILPDPDLERWVIDIAREYADSIGTRRISSPTVHQ